MYRVHSCVGCINVTQCHVWLGSAHTCTNPQRTGTFDKKGPGGYLYALETGKKGCPPPKFALLLYPKSINRIYKHNIYLYRTPRQRLRSPIYVFRTSCTCFLAGDMHMFGFNMYQLVHVFQVSCFFFHPRSKQCPVWTGSNEHASPLILISQSMLPIHDGLKSQGAYDFLPMQASRLVGVRLHIPFHIITSDEVS